MIKNKYFYIISIILLFFFYINYYQLSNQHWSSLIDQDTIQIYNSLLIASGLEQEYRDHPAFSTFLIHGFVFKIKSIFNSSFLLNIDSILNSKNTDEIFQHYFHIARITNYFINFFLLIFFYNFLKKIKIDQSLNIKIIILLSLSQWYVLSFFSLRSENLSLLLFIIASIFLISNTKVVINKFISGIFLALSMLAKIQIIFLFPIYIFLLIPFYSKNNLEFFFNSSKIKFFNFFLFLSFYLFFICWFVLQLFLQEHIRFSNNKYFDLIIFSFGFIVINVYYFFISNNNIEEFQKKVSSLSLSIFGFISCITAFVMIDFFNIFNINKYIFLRISNPFHYMSEFTKNMAYGVVDINFLFNVIYKVLSAYLYSYVELFLLFISLLLLYFRRNILPKNYIKKIITLFTIFLLIAFVTNLRSEIYYHSYYFFVYLLIFTFCIKVLDFKIVNLLLAFSFLLTIYNNFYLSQNNYDKIFSRTSSLDYVCSSHNTSKKIEIIDYFKYWHTKINNEVLTKICN